MAAEAPDETAMVDMSAVEIQQEYYETVGDADWELYEKKDRHRLLQKIAIALCGPPTEEGDLLDCNDQHTLKLQGYDSRSEEITMKVFNKICQQEKYSHNGENILISVLRVICVAPAKDVPFFKKTPLDYWVDLHTKKGKDVFISIFHVFSIRKCISLQPGVKSCRVFIDHDARVYKDWKSYLEENNLPKSVLIVPENGEYKGVIQNVPVTYDNFITPLVELSVLPSPALGVSAKILSIADTTNTVAGIGAIVVGAVGLIAAPVAAPLTVGTVLVVGAATSVYGIIRSSIHLADRGKHEQDIGLKNSESRACWLNILVSTAGISFSAAQKLVVWAASTGTNFKIILNAVQFLKYTTIASGLLGMVNGFGEMIHKYKKYNEKPTKLELFQFTSSLLFFGIGVMSNQTAQEIVEDAQTKSIIKIRDSLTSNAKRKMFDKIAAETRRLQGIVKGNTDIIKGLKMITDKNEFFAKLSKIKKELNVNKLRISLRSDGKILINNQNQMTLSKLTELGKAGRDKVFTTLGPAKVTMKNRLVATASVMTTAISCKNTIFNVRPEELLKIATFIKTLCQVDMDFICSLLSELAHDVHRAFMLLCIELLDSLIPIEVDYYLSFLGADWKMQVIYYVFDFLESQLSEGADRATSINYLLKEFILNGRIKPESLEMLRDMVMGRVSEERKRNTGANSCPRKYDGLYELRKKSLIKYKELQAGEIVEIGNHKVLIKNATIEKLQEYFAEFSQEECDLFLELCFKVVWVLSSEDLDLLNLVNVDEDVLMRVATFIMDWNVVKELLNECKKNGCIDMNIVFRIKNGAMDWALVEKVRNHVICTGCKGIRYCN